MLNVLDLTLEILHIVVILFNCTGWIWKRTRRIHLWVISITAFSWFVLGIWYGWGYCFLTDWAWEVKAKLGVTGLPNSYVQYVFDRIGLRIQSATIDIITVSAFAVSLVMSMALNWKDRRDETTFAKASVGKKMGEIGKMREIEEIE